MGKDHKNNGETSLLTIKELIPDLPEPQHPYLLPQSKKYNTLRVVLLKPSKYDDEGYVIRFWKGVLPSNTLNVLRGLTEDIARRRALGGIHIQVDAFDETAEHIPVKKIVQWSRQPATKLVVCL